MSKFLNKYTIKISKVPKYTDFNGKLLEFIDPQLAKLILESKDPRISDESREEFRKMMACAYPKSAMCPVKYRNRHGLGRFYPECPTEYLDTGARNPTHGKYYSGLISMPRIIKNTIFHYQEWVDIDQVKGHPTMLHDLATRNELAVPGLKDYLEPGRFDEYVKILGEFYSADPKKPLTTKHVKHLFNSTIYGGGFKKWVESVEEGKMKGVDQIWTMEPVALKNKDKKHELYTKFKNDLTRLTDKIYAANPEIVELVCGDLSFKATDNEYERSRVLHDRKSRVMSYVCGTIEHEITYQAYKFAKKNSLVPTLLVSWGYDGFTAPASTSSIRDEGAIDAINAHVQKVTGMPTVRFVIKEFSPDELLTDCLDARNEMPDFVRDESPTEDQVLEDNYQAWKKEFEKDWCKVLDQSVFLRTSGSTPLFKKHGDFVVSYGHLHVLDKNGRKEQCIAMWHADQNMRTYDRIGCYPPPMECPERVFNTWADSPFEGTSGNADHEGVRLFINHLKILCNHDHDTAEFFLDWIAQSLQQPGKKVGSMITLISSQGAGKTSVVQYLRALYGLDKVLETTTPERDVWGHFNGPMATAFLVVLSEVDKRNSLGSDGKIKALVTDEFVPINPKGMAPYTIQSFHRFIMCTNNLDPVTTSEDDRRNVIVRASDEMIGNTEYFTQLHENLKNAEVLEGLFAFFMDRDISTRNFARPPTTAYHTTIKSCNKSTFDAFMENFTYTHRASQYVDRTGTSMLQDFKEWCFEHGVDDKMSSAQLVKNVILRLPSGATAELQRTNTGRPRRYYMNVLKRKYNVDQEQSDAKVSASVPLFIVQPKPNSAPSPIFQTKPVPAPVVQPKPVPVPTPVIAQPIKQIEACPDNVPHLAVWTATHGHGDKVQWGATTLTVHLTPAKKRNLSDGKTLFIPRLGDAANHLTMAPDQITPVQVQASAPEEPPVPTKKAKHTRPATTTVCMFEDEE